MLHLYKKYNFIQFPRQIWFGFFNSLFGKSVNIVDKWLKTDWAECTVIAYMKV